MITATGFRRRPLDLGLIKPALPSLNQPTLAPPTGIDVPGWGGFNPGGRGPGLTPPITPPPAPIPPKTLKNYFFTAAVGPTAGGSAPDAPSRPPPATAPSDAAVTVTSGGGYATPPAITTPTPSSTPPTIVVPTGDATQPSATNPTATVVAPADGGARSWWPWAVGAAVIAVIGGVLLHQRG